MDISHISVVSEPHCKHIGATGGDGFDRRALQQLALNVHVKHSDMT